MAKEKDTGDYQFSFDDLNPDYQDPKEEKKKRRKRTKDALAEIEEKIIDVEYSEVMRKSYIDYSMSVITARALPDVRDGLKPVQRRIVYDMSELGVAADKPHRKVARIVGDTMGKYHPHGDASIANALVVQAQDWKQMAPLVDGHGNFGSIEGDGAAAPRYIEARMTRYTEDVLLSDLKSDTVDFIANYDEQEKEPVILPAKLPNLLINGAEGIAVGMATSIPTHNIGEVIDAACHYLDHPEATTAELMEFLPGPDFPTGGIVANRSQLKEIYETGQGKIRLRGRMHLEEGKTRDYFVITEIPQTMIGEGIGKFLQSVADLVENKTLPEITDIANQSSKEGIRIVIEVKKGADLPYIENVLYKKTKLEDTFGVNMLAICKGRPETLSLADIYREFTAFQYEIYTRKYRTILRKAEKKREVDEGLVQAIDMVDTIIEVLRGSKTVKMAKNCLMTGNTEGIKFKTREAERLAKSLYFTDLQATAILELKLSRLVGLELEVLKEDLAKVLRLIRKCERLLGSRAEMRAEIKKGLVALREKYAAPRRTALLDLSEAAIQEKPEEILPVYVLIDRFHYIHAVDPSVYERNKENAGDYRHVFLTATDQKLIIFTEGGKAHTLKVKDIPLTKFKEKGVPIDNISGYESKDEIVTAILPLDAKQELIFVSSDGFVKRVDFKEFDVTRKTVDATKLMDGARIVAIQPFTGESIALYTRKGYHIRFMQEEIPKQGKGARGAIGIRLEADDEVTEVNDGAKLRFTKRGGKGKK